MIEGNTPKNKLQTDKIMFEVYQMKYQFIDWDSIPDVINKDQFYQICHISKSTALHLLKSGKVPCEWTGKKTRCYKIKKEDVKDYLQTRAVYSVFDICWYTFARMIADTAPPVDYGAEDMFAQGSVLSCMACGNYFVRRSSRQRYCQRPEC